MKKRVVVMASGSGSNLQALLEEMKQEDYPAECVLVLSNKADAGALARAKDFGVEALFLDPALSKDKESYDRDLAAAVHRTHPDFICLAGYMRILSASFINAFPGKIINIHPSLLPKYGGKGMFGRHVHEAVIRAGDSVSGATVHWVTAQVDAGEIILQAAVPVETQDDASSLAARVLELEHRLYPEALRRVCGEKS